MSQYTNEITNISEQELKPVFKLAESPVCLIGGWAVHIHVNKEFQKQHSRQYIGSRDIDIGFHIDPKWNKDKLKNSPVGKSIKKFRKNGYIPHRFGFLQYFDRQTKTNISKERAKCLPPHRVFEMHIDIIPDTKNLDTFNEVFKFKPPSESLLRKAFQKNASEPLSKYKPWTLSKNVLIADPDLLAAMKIKSIPYRNKNHKKIKDIADLYSLLWYVKNYKDMKKNVLKIASSSDLKNIKDINDQTYQDAAKLLNIDMEDIKASITGLSN